MADRHSSSEIFLDVTAGRERVESEPESETPFRIVILGDFSGRANRQQVEIGDALANRRPISVDRDNFDSVFAKLSPRLNLVLGGKDGYQATLKFGELEDFHPDRLFQQVQLFRKLRDTREKLTDPATFAQTAAELGVVERRPSVAPPAPSSPPRVSNSEVQQVVSGSLLDQMLEATEAIADRPRPSRAPDELASLIHRIVAPHIVPKADPRQAELLALIDLATSNQMNALLHLPEFQALESAWRAVFFLVRNVETDARLKLLLIDLSKEELAADLASSEDLRSTGTYKLLVEKTVGTPGAEPWAVMAGNFTFGSSAEDMALLGRMAKLAAAAGAPFLAGANLDLVGCESIVALPDPRQWKKQPNAKAAEAWAGVRNLPEARYVGLVLPRFLLRLPYGKNTEATEFFEFEELDDPANHEDYLWSNPVFAPVLLLAQAYAEQGWGLRPGALAGISGLPVHIYTEDGESRAKPCAEVLMTQTAAEEIVEKGIMLLASLKDQPAVRLVRFQSIANPPAALAGRWSS
ncbi:MAG: type VI secretion system contractile sheath large subunit [Terriglobia bacterium]|jgi:type VI secretion system protein ImpC